jgi:hypothetical protein
MRDRGVILLNVLLPGGGLIWVGYIRAGLLLGLAFAACANSVLAATLLLPDEFAAWAKLAGLLLTVVSYAAAQGLLAQGLRRRAEQEYAALRKRVLGEAMRRAERGEHAAALHSLDRLSGSAARDLLVAFRRAQILSAAQDVPRARAAWAQVAALDEHGIYRNAARECLARLGEPS